MRCLSRATAALAACLALVTGAGAGVFNTWDPDPPLREDFPVFQNRLTQLRQLIGEVEPEIVKDTAAETPDQKRVKLIGKLGKWYADHPNLKMLAKDRLTDEERLNLGAYLVRVGRFAEASAVLDPKAFQKENEFLAYAAMATADFLNANAPDKKGNAITNLSDALRKWPKEWDKLPPERQKWFENSLGWNKERFQWYRLCDEYLLKLMRLRRATPKHPLGDDVDALFPLSDKDGKPVRFVGAAGKYQAGTLADAEKAKLPSDALQVVQQLLLWMPGDDRLYWLLGELRNAQGFTEGALDIFKEIGVKKYYLREVDELFGAAAMPLKKDAQGNLVKGPDGQYLKASPLDSKGKYPEAMREHILALKEHAAKAKAEPVTPPGKKDDTPIKPPPPKPQPKSDDKEGPVLDVRALGVGFGLGVVVAVLGYWQYHEIRRRRG